MAQLKSYIRGLFWSEKDNIYTAQLNNVDDTVIVHDMNDGLTLLRMIKQDPNGFKDFQAMRDLYNNVYDVDYNYNNVVNEFIDRYANVSYSIYLGHLLEDYTEETEQTPTVTEDEAIVTITPTNNMLIKVAFGNDTEDNDITVKVYKSTTLIDTINVKADKDNDFEYFVKSTDIDTVEISWIDNDNNNTIVTLTEPSDNDGE